MKITLSEKIRALRKARSLTQEQLAEALGVTVGAVYKWEAGLSTPELGLLLELADFFDVSVDALLGYMPRNNSREATVKRLETCRHEKDPNGPMEAEKALKRYPNAFDVVYQSAMVFHMAGLERNEKPLQERSIQLFEHATHLLDQNTDPRISKLSIQIEIAETYVSLGQGDRAVELLMQENPCRINEARIGMTLATVCNRPREALPHLSQALLRCMTKLLQTVMGYANVYLKLDDYDSAKAILHWVLELLPGLKKPGQSNSLEKAAAMLWGWLALIEYKSGSTEGAKAALRQAKTIAIEFDKAPSYEADDLRFVTLEQRGTFHDDIGGSAMDGVTQNVVEEEIPAFTALWKEISQNEQ